MSSCPLSALRVSYALPNTHVDAASDQVYWYLVAFPRSRHLSKNTNRHSHFYGKLVSWMVRPPLGYNAYSESYLICLSRLTTSSSPFTSGPSTNTTVLLFWANHFYDTTTHDTTSRRSPTDLLLHNRAHRLLAYPTTPSRTSLSLSCLTSLLTSLQPPPHLSLRLNPLSFPFLASVPYLINDTPRPCITIPCTSLATPVL